MKKIDSNSIKEEPIAVSIRRSLGMPEPSATHSRLINSTVEIATNSDPEDISYHHTVFCQTCLPYRRVTDRIWERNNGVISMSIEAGRALDPETNQWVELPLPFGPKARLLQIHLDTQAKLQNNPMVELGSSMTSFIKQLQGYSPTGPELRKFKEQASAIMGALFRFATSKGGRTIQLDSKIVSSFELWYPRDENQRVLFPSYIRLSDEYFSSLQKHAVPLDPRAITAIQHSSLLLDIYKWLVQRLCRVPLNKPAFIPWPMVKAQFGQGYTRIRDFRAVFLKALEIVITQYPGAKVKADDRGLTLYHSRPPILPRELKQLS